MKDDGEQGGELIGPSVNGNSYKLDFHEWYPFEKSIYESGLGWEANFKTPELKKNYLNILNEQSKLIHLCLISNESVRFVKL